MFASPETVPSLRICPLATNTSTVNHTSNSKPFGTAGAYFLPVVVSAIRTRVQRATFNKFPWWYFRGKCPIYDNWIT